MADLLDPNLASKLTASLNGLYAGSYLAGVFYGLTTHQTFVYFRRSGKDPIYTRLLVLLLWVLDTLHAVLAAVALRKVIEESIVNPLSMLINKVPWTLSFSLFMMSFSDSCVRGFYCYRIWRLSKNNGTLTTVAVFPVICALIAGLYSTAGTVGKSGLQALNLIESLDATLISICVADSILAGFLCVLLWNSRSGIKRTNSVISTLILYTVTTGLLTSLVAIATLIIMLTMKETFAYAGAFYMLSKLYFSSLLATLNRREKIRTQMDGTNGMISIPLETGNSRGFKGVGILSFKLGDEVSTARSGTSTRQQDESEPQVGEVGLENKNPLHHSRIEINVEADTVQNRDSSGYTEGHGLHSLQVNQECSTAWESSISSGNHKLCTTNNCAINVYILRGSIKIKQRAVLLHFSPCST
ncbi:hypothetical protein GALMADRAFT_278747 [Galerina marginata CBS 339.88]|uniref:DUF6534 domain-containing protein n=1 Tax=Galerina marginata (strain CBS 339.88) TaxID=685588 RepID=A0A067T5Q3_GALM3|nr:hypothetical protein GALMADRAFT_278747 [Galerina marginata CBS 339.88]